MSRGFLGHVLYLIPQLYVIIITLNIVSTLSEDSCSEVTNCKNCIQTPECVWCKNVITNLRGRCMFRGYARTQECKEFKVATPRSEIVKNEGTRGAKSLENGVNVPPIHIAPQVMNLELRVGDPVEIKMEYFDAEEKPLDLYFLMDLSNSMINDRETVAKQSKDLAQELRRLTSDVRFGFGSFVDKPIPPFVSSKLLLDLERNHSIPFPYSFKNHQPLDESYTKFKEALETTKNSKNTDAPESGLDAVMQTIVCTDKIGWRNNSRKLLIMSTDDPSHVAGDGKAAGIVTPNDGECHLENGTYTHEKILDYPSIAQLNAKVKTTGVHVVFAVKKNMVAVYEELHQGIENSAVVTLEKDSKNIVEVLKMEYRRIQSTLELNEDRGVDGSRDYEIVYKYQCNGTTKLHNYKTKKPSCSTTLSQNIIFTITVQLLQSACSHPNSDMTRTVSIAPSELLGREKLLLNIKAICDCSCKNNTCQDGGSERAEHQELTLDEYPAITSPCLIIGPIVGIIVIIGSILLLAKHMYRPRRQEDSQSEETGETSNELVKRIQLNSIQILISIIMNVLSRLKRSFSF